MKHTIQEKNSRASMSQLLACLLIIQNPENKNIDIRASQAHNKEEIESTLRNMKFKSFTVSIY
jgi:hypothetical protein